MRSRSRATEMQKCYTTQLIPFRLVQMGPDGMKVTPVLHIDRNHLPTGPAQSHGMLLN
jgi:hypothetical protein